jgi:hypothetical protein
VASRRVIECIGGVMQVQYQGKVRFRVPTAPGEPAKLEH